MPIKTMIRKRWNRGVGICSNRRFSVAFLSHNFSLLLCLTPERIANWMPCDYSAYTRGNWNQKRYEKIRWKFNTECCGRSTIFNQTKSSITDYWCCFINDTTSICTYDQVWVVDVQLRSFGFFFSKVKAFEN